MSRPYCLYSANGISIQVELPELDDKYMDDITDEMRERAVKAVCTALPETCKVFIDGKNKPPAVVRFHPWNLDDAQEWEIDG